MLKRHQRLVAARLRDIAQPWSVNRLSTALGALGLAFVLAAAGFIAWKEHTTASREARERAEETAFFTAEQAARLFEVADLALRSTAAAIGTEDWDRVASSQALWAEIRALRDALPYVGNVWLNDAAGRLRLTTLAFPSASSAAAAGELFRALAAGTEVAIGPPLAENGTDRTTLSLARRLVWPDGRFRGAVSATLSLSHFRSVWSRLDLPNGEHIALVRGEDGMALARYPQAAPNQPEQTALTSALALHPESGSFVPQADESGFYQRVGALPVYIVVSFTRSSVARAWRAWFWGFLPFPLAALAALGLVMSLGMRQARAERRAQRSVEAARAELSTANQRLEQRVAERTADLMESNEETQRFAYIVSHDLRAPLINIMGFTSELQHLRAELFAPAPPGGVSEADRPGADLRDEFDEALGFITASIDKMDRLIKAILLLARQGQRSFVQEAIQMDDMMRSIADGFAHQVQATGATILVGPLPALVADRMAVEQIFSNLIDNAVKYLRPGVPGRIEIVGYADRNKATFTVRDNGRGIEPRDHARVFDLFRRSGRQDKSGEGIGLAYVRTLVRKLGGTVALESALEDGSCFTVVLPLGNEKDWA